MPTAPADPSPTEPLPIDALLFDFDGVVLDSASLKEIEFHELMKEQAPDHVDAAMAYYYLNGGVSRVAKFRHIWSAIVGRPKTEDEVMELNRLFSERVVRRVTTCPYIAGAEAFLERWH
ncbi:MAG: HAD family hydrolase, partial [Planctomycetia bacterium]